MAILALAPAAAPAQSTTAFPSYRAADDQYPPDGGGGGGGQGDGTQGNAGGGGNGNSNDGNGDGNNGSNNGHGGNPGGGREASRNSPKDGSGPAASVLGTQGGRGGDPGTSGALPFARSNGGNLPFTGFDLLTLSLLAALLVAGGFGLRVLTRARGARTRAG